MSMGVKPNPTVDPHFRSLDIAVVGQVAMAVGWRLRFCVERGTKSRFSRRRRTMYGRARLGHLKAVWGVPLRVMSRESLAQRIGVANEVGVDTYERSILIYILQLARSAYWFRSGGFAGKWLAFVRILALSELARRLRICARPAQS